MLIFIPFIKKMCFVANFVISHSLSSIPTRWQKLPKYQRFSNYLVFLTAPPSPLTKSCFYYTRWPKPYYIKIFITSCLAYDIKLAQMVEWLRQQTCKQKVLSSIPSGVIFFFIFSHCLIWGRGRFAIVHVDFFQSNFSTFVKGCMIYFLILNK